MIIVHRNSRSIVDYTNFATKKWYVDVNIFPTKTIHKNRAEQPLLTVWNHGRDSEWVAMGNWDHDLSICVYNVNGQEKIPIPIPRYFTWLLLTWSISCLRQMVRLASIFSGRSPLYLLQLSWKTIRNNNKIPNTDTDQKYPHRPSSTLHLLQGH